jgi:hypothetical protein
MGFFDSLQAFVQSVEQEYDRRIRSASNVKQYDPTGASHHGHVAIHNERVEHVDRHLTDGHTPEPEEATAQEQASPRQVTHHKP